MSWTSGVRLVEHLDRRNAIHVGHSTGGGEAARYVAKFEVSFVSKTLQMR
jgi:non-heme chloroperoxidase